MATPFVFGSHDRMKDLERRIGFIARSGLPVLIEGASGTGKEALAELLHFNSGTAAAFTRIICRKSGSGVYPELASTTSRPRDLSALDSSMQGTVFLKNVYLLSPAEQDQILTILDEMGARHNGNNQGATPRIISSTTEPLEPLISRRELNPALYHRLSVYRIYLPPLRERREDIPELFAHMVRRAVNGGSAPQRPPSALLDVMMAYDWPGNLHELQNVARTYVVTADADEIIAELSERSRQTPRTSQGQQDQRSLKEQVKRASQKLESEIILRTLERHHWNRRRAAQSLQISYRALLYKMKNCDLRTELQTTPEEK
ncbi:MAG: hypothetical protein DMG57_18770 [Acidobacteria bacterium]|nr:MAG: hypothetical protein DMG57_18770 [Acidobacteriota bacterium]